MAYTLTQTWIALKTWPEMKHWRSAFGLAMPTLLFIAGIGYLSGWVSFAPLSDPSEIATTILIMFFVPAMLTEILFRGFALAGLTQLTPRWSGWLSTLLFVIWHPLASLVLGLPWSEVFFQPSFLVSAFVFGIILTHIRIVSASLWPVILIHWLAIVIWRIFLGGPFY